MIKARITLTPELLEAIHADGAAAYPEEGAGLLLGLDDNNTREVRVLLPLSNAREDEARHNRYLITPQDMMRGENEAARLGFDVLGVYHSHPDHPNRPSEYDREWALPWYSYIITSVRAGKAEESRSWRLAEDRSHFEEEEILIEALKTLGG
jgi:proteasome lid subunit RPN8/RPN11